MNTQLIKDFISKKSTTALVGEDGNDMLPLNDFLEFAELGEYLNQCTPSETIIASGVRLLPIGAIKDEMTEGAAPGSYLRRFGYLVVATSVGGNAICFHGPSGKIFWADHTSFHDDSICYEDRSTRKWKYLYEYNPANVMQALVELGDNVERFLLELLTDKLTEKLEALD